MKKLLGLIAVILIMGAVVDGEMWDRMAGTATPASEPPTEEEKQAAEEAGFVTVRTWRKAQEAGVDTKEDWLKHLAEANKRKRQKQENCRNELQCWGDKHSIDASVACQPVIERQAKYQAEWTDGWLDPKFTHLRWKDKSAGTITYIGDKVKFQNGFGAWQHMTYECDYSPNRKTVVGIRIQPGKL